MYATWPYRNRVRLVASVSVLAGAVALLVFTEWGSLLESSHPSAEHSEATVSPSPGPLPAAAAPISATDTPGLTGGPTPVRAFGAPSIPPPQPEGPRSTLADTLNASDGSAKQDVATVAELLANYLGVFQKLPVGTNGEITAALAGDNAQALAPLPADHPAIDTRGELIDRWGTPFFFHQLSRAVMEIRSAGPDRRPFTADDIVWPESSG